MVSRAAALWEDIFRRDVRTYPNQCFFGGWLSTTDCPSEGPRKGEVMGGHCRFASVSCGEVSSKTRFVRSKHRLRAASTVSCMPLKRTRNSQKIININGRIVGRKSTFVLRNKAGNT